MADARSGAILHLVKKTSLNFNGVTGLMLQATVGHQ